MTYSPTGPQLDQHIGREHECYQRIALLSRRIPANILSHGCQTEVALLCSTTDLTVTAMLDTGCSPGNYMSDAFYQSHVELLKEFLVPGKAERVDLATNNSAKQITQHIVIDVRHVDSRGTTRTLKLRFGVLEGLRFDIVIGLYAIAMNFMEVMQDLLTLQLEHQEARTNNLAMLYGQQPCLLMLTGSDDGDGDDSVESTDSIPSVLPRGLRPPILSGITAQTMRRNPWYYDAEQLADQEAYELTHPVPWVDHNDGEDLMSQDTIENPTQPITILRRQQNAAIAAAHNVRQDAAIAAARNPHPCKRTNGAAVQRASSGQPRSNVIAGMTLQTMMANPTFFDEGQISDQRAYESGHIIQEPPDDDGPNERRYSMAFEYLMQGREPPRVRPVNEDANAYGSRRYYKDDPYQHSRLTRSHLANPPSANIDHQQAQCHKDLDDYTLRKYYKEDPRPTAGTTAATAALPLPSRITTVPRQPSLLPYSGPSGVMPLPRSPTVHCPDDHKRHSSQRITAFRRFEATLPQAPIRSNTMLHNWSSSIPMPPQSLHDTDPQVLDDDEVPDLLDPDESGDESLTSLTTFFPEIPSASIQPVGDVSGFSLQLHEVSTERHFPNEPRSTPNPQSPNLSLTQFNQQESNQSTSASVPRMSSDTPERNFERQARRCLARHTVDIQRRLYMADAPLATLPPFDECRVRRWLRQLYPYEFRAFLAVQITPEVSLELAEVRALFRALILRNINIKWFRDNLFTPPLLEHLAILLRNQHDRFLLDFYHQGNIDIPRTQNTNLHVWRTVLCHVAFSDQRHDDMWRVDFHEGTLHDGQHTEDNEHLDDIVSKLLEGYDGSPFVPVPSTPVYRTLDPTTYDTLYASFTARRHGLVESQPHSRFPSFLERHVAMLALQEPQLPPPVQAPNDLEQQHLAFYLSTTMTNMEHVALQRSFGPVYNLIQLAHMQRGQLSPLPDNRSVRIVLRNHLHRFYAYARRLPTPDLNSNAQFESHEYTCLLRALLDGTLQPDQYMGRMLPLALVRDLISYVRDEANRLLNYARSSHTLGLPPPEIFFELIESDAIMEIVSSVFHTDLSRDQWYRSYQSYIQDPDCLEITLIILQTAESLNVTDSIADSVLTNAVKSFTKHRMTGVKNSPPPEAVSPGNPLYSVQQRIARYLEMRTNTPPQRHVRLGQASELSEASVEQQFQIHLNSPHGQPLHLRDPIYLQQQRFLFNANLLSVALLHANDPSAASTSLIGSLSEQPPADPSLQPYSPHDDDDFGYFQPPGHTVSDPHQTYGEEQGLSQMHDERPRDRRGRLITQQQPPPMVYQDVPSTSRGSVASSQTQRRRITRGAWEKRTTKASKSTPDADGHKASLQRTFSLPTATRPTAMRHADRDNHSHMDVDDSDSDGTSSYNEYRG